MSTRIKDILTLLGIAFAIFFMWGLFKLCGMMGDRSRFRERGVSISCQYINGSTDTIYIPVLEMDLWLTGKNGIRYADTIRINKVKYGVFLPHDSTLINRISYVPKRKLYLKDLRINDSLFHVLCNNKTITIHLNDTLKWKYSRDSLGNITCYRTITNADL